MHLSWLKSFPISVKNCISHALNTVISISSKSTNISEFYQYREYFLNKLCHSQSGLKAAPLGEGHRWSQVELWFGICVSQIIFHSQECCDIQIIFYSQFGEKYEINVTYYNIVLKSKFIYEGIWFSKCNYHYPYSGQFQCLQKCNE